MRLRPSARLKSTERLFSLSAGDLRSTYASARSKAGGSGARGILVEDNFGDVKGWSKPLTVGGGPDGYLISAGGRGAVGAYSSIVVVGRSRSGGSRRRTSFISFGEARRDLGSMA